MKVRSEVLNFYNCRLKVRIEGFRTDRLLNEACSAGLTIRQVYILSDIKAEGWIASSDLPVLKKLAGAKYRITVISGAGPGYRMKMSLKKPVTMAGILIAAVIVSLQSLFVAAIDIDGYKGIPEDSLRCCLEKAGVYEGAFRPSIDWDGARNALRADFPELTWIQLVYDGRTVILNIEESSHPILRADDKTVPLYSDIVAEQDGYIETISTLQGAAMAEPGDYVKAGDVLISGTVRMQPTTFQEDWPTEYYVRAKGEITALVPYRLTFYQERYVQDERQDGEMTLSDKREKTRQEAEAVLKQQIRLWKKENLPENAEIVNESLNFCYKNNIIEIGVTIEVRKQIGIEKEIIVGPQNSDN